MGPYSVREESRAYIVLDARFPNNWHRQMLGKSLYNFSIRYLSSFYELLGWVTPTLPALS
jgi:hypothetical protein